MSIKTIDGKPVADTDLFAVTFGEEIHLYPASQEVTASQVFVVGVGAFGDGAMHRVSREGWMKARKASALRRTTVVDHTHRR